MPQAVSMILMIVVLVGMFLFMQRGESKRKKQYEEMLNAVEVNDDVTTKSGILGKVIKLEDDIMVIQAGVGSDKIRFKMLKSSIAYITKPGDGLASEKE